MNIPFSLKFDKTFQMNAVQLLKCGATNMKVGLGGGWGGQCIGRWGVNTVKTPKYEKGEGA